MAHCVLGGTSSFLLLALALGSGGAGKLAAAELQPETVEAWEAYRSATERRITAELASPRGFLALDFQDPSVVRADRRALLAGEIPVVKVASTDENGKEILVPGGMIHHWRGSVFLPGARLEDLLARVSNPTAENTRQEDVLASRVLERGPDTLKLYLKLQRSKFVTVVYNTEHQVRYARLGEFRATSRSVATRIVELENPNTAEEKERPQGRDSGYLWRLNSYWRYEQMNGGVIVECESISLSRSIPAVLDYVIRPLVNKVARESMQRTLDSLRKRGRTTMTVAIKGEEPG